MPLPVPLVRPWPASACGDVVVRLVDLAADDDTVARAAAALTPGELARARRGTPAVHRRRVLLRAALRSVLAEELGTAPADVPLATTPAGRPELALDGTGLDANCAASGALGLVAVGRGRRVGVDVERVAPWNPEVLEEGWLSGAERRALTLLPPEFRPVAATRAWTQKEAVLKARGTGLREDPAATVTAIGRADGVVAGWQVSSVPVPDGWVASLAAAPEQEMPS
ncbi:4'-phosphopantetheinyl transferase family protein [Geodermatophilus sp. SYSU D00703]